MRVAVAMSGGVDSTAAALLLKREGHDVVGFHMRLHEGSDATWEHARRAADSLEVPLRGIDLTDRFDEIVIGPFIESYLKGLTPSPCPVCNRFIKASLLFEAARSDGCERLATGHYARIGTTVDGPGLFRARDEQKDQSYFLFMLSREILARTLFPLGGRTKLSVRHWLREEGIGIWESEESQELCFMSTGDYRDFLRSHGVAAEPGPIKGLDGSALGMHKGITRYTIGQRRGLGICGPKPHYVIRIDAATNTVYVGSKEQTYVPGLRMNRLNLLTASMPETGDRFRVKVRSNSQMAWCSVAETGPDHMDLMFDRPRSAIAPGQAAVLYSDDRVVGGGWIETALT